MNSQRLLSFLLALSAPLAAVRAQEAEAAAEPAPTTAAEPEAVKVVTPKGAYADLAESGFDLTSALLGGGPAKKKPFYELVGRLRALAADDAEVVLLDLSHPLSLNLAQVAELERVLRELRAADKRCIAYLEHASRVHYAIASQCDRILLADMGGVDLGSLAMSTTFLRDALDFLGVQMDVLRCGDFKGAAEPFMHSRMSPHLRAHMLDLLRHMNDDVVRLVSEGRGIGPEKVRELQRRRLFSAEDALLAGLVDRIVPWQGARRSLEEMLAEPVAFEPVTEEKKRRSINVLAMLQNLFNRGDDDEEVESATLAVLHLSGPIVDGTDAAPGSIVSGPMVRTIRELRDNEQVRGIVVRINSPGGSASASEAVVLALEDLAKHKPVVCSMGYVAGSGGYWITCFGRPILAEPGTVTGSIGVLGVKPNVGPLMRRLGIHQELIALDDGPLYDALDRSWTDAQKQEIQRLIDEVYDRFLEHVARSRGMTREDVEAIAGGRVWSGEQAVRNGLVDRIGGLFDALAMVADEAGLDPDAYEVRHLPRPKSFMDVFASSLLEARAPSLAGLLPEVPPALVGRLGGLEVPLAMLRDALETSGRPRAWAVMPAQILVR